MTGHDRNDSKIRLIGEDLDKSAVLYGYTQLSERVSPK